MRHFIGCDAHKKYSLFVVVDEAGDRKLAERVNHDRESYRTFLRGGSYRAWDMVPTNRRCSAFIQSSWASTR
jgi:hypothetical protein